MSKGDKLCDRDTAPLALLAGTLLRDRLCCRWHHHRFIDVSVRVAAGAVVHLKAIGTPPLLPHSLLGTRTSFAPFQFAFQLSHTSVFVGKRRAAEFVGNLQQFAVLGLRGGSDGLGFQLLVASLPDGLAIPNRRVTLQLGRPPLVNKGILLRPAGERW